MAAASLVLALAGCQSPPDLIAAHKLSKVAHDQAAAKKHERYVAALRAQRAKAEALAFAIFDYELALRRTPAGQVPLADIKLLLDGPKSPDGKPKLDAQGRPILGLKDTLAAIEKNYQRHVLAWDLDQSDEDYQDLHKDVAEYLGRRGISEETQRRVSQDAGKVAERLIRERERRSKEREARRTEAEE